MKKKEKDFLSVLNKVRNKRNQTYKKVFVAAGAAVIMIVVISSGLAMTRVKKKLRRRMPNNRVKRWWQKAVPNLMWIRYNRK